MNNYFWRKGSEITLAEFKKLVLTKKEFYDKLAVDYLNKNFFKAYSMDEKCAYIIAENYSSNDVWFWAWCFTAKAISTYKWDTADKHVYNSSKRKLYTGNFFKKRNNILCRENKDIIAFGRNFEDFEIK